METKVIKKRFFSSAKECKWLNEQGQNGYLLIARTENSYTFELTPKQLHYSVEWLDCSPECEEALAYIEAYREQDVTLATTYSLWAYFVSEHPIEMGVEARRRIAVRYRNTALWLCAADLITAVLIGYHLSIRPFLETNSVMLEAPVLEKASNGFLQLVYRLWYGAEKIFYFYAKFCSHLFGQTKASLALGIMIPLGVVLAVLTALWVGEWLRNAPPKTNQNKEELSDVCQEPKASGETENDC